MPQGSRARTHGRARLDPSLVGFVLCGASALFASAICENHHSTGWLGAWCAFCCTLFGGISLLWPITMGTIGLLLLIDARTANVVGPMALASVCGIFLFADYFHEGVVGGWMNSMLSTAFGDAHPHIIQTLLALLGFTLLGISPRGLITGTTHALGRAWRWAYDIRLPNAAEFAEAFSRAPRKAPRPQAAFAPARIVSVKVESIVEPVPEAHFVETPAAPDAASAHASRYSLPRLDLFVSPGPPPRIIENREGLIVQCFASFKIAVTIPNKIIGPSVTRYEVKPGEGVKVARILDLSNDIALALAAKGVRIEAPVPGKSVVGIEVPNETVAPVRIRELLELLPRRKDGLMVVLGKDVSSKPVFADLCEMPHLLIGGTTGSGKSVGMNAIIASLLTTRTPDQLQLVMIDPKRVELTVYNGIPHLLQPVITDPLAAVGALKRLARTMDERGDLFAKAGVRNISEYNAKNARSKVPYIVIIIDEMADLMEAAGKDFEAIVKRLAAMARSAGIHLVAATQRPSVDVIPGTLKANIPSRIAYAVGSMVDSETIIDMPGAEKLLGRGDMLFLPVSESKPIRVQGANITIDEVTRLVEFWSAHDQPENLTELEDMISEAHDAPIDPLARDAALYFCELGYGSTAKIISRFTIGHPRATRIMNTLEELGVIGPPDGKKPRALLAKTAEQIDEILAERGDACLV